MSYSANEQQYLLLIGQFSGFEINVDTFCDKWFSLWKANRDEQISQMSLWAERYDLKLQEALKNKEITAEEFSEKWVELWGYAGYQQLLEMVDHIFSACDCYNPEPQEKYEIDEPSLRAEVR